VLTASIFLTLCSCSLRVASKLPRANLLLLKDLLLLLQNISSNAGTSRMTATNLAICLGPNLLGPPEEHTLPLGVLMQVTGKVRAIYQPATAFRAQPSFAAQRHRGCLLSSANARGWEELLGRAAPQLQLAAQEGGSGVGKAV